MKKRFLVPTLALSILGGVVAGSVLNTSVFAANSDTNSNVEVSEKMEQQQLEKKATVTKKEAISIALKKVAGNVKEAELEDEDGTVVYGVEVKDAKGQEQEIKVDGKTGKVLKIEADDKDGHEDEDNDSENEQD